jgi:hypothetical protein|tara:strand:+ start:173 stop:355 length:183 start_codon:yes stop_codon:yes gene_type:complete
MVSLKETKKDFCDHQLFEKIFSQFKNGIYLEVCFKTPSSNTKKGIFFHKDFYWMRPPSRF